MRRDDVRIRVAVLALVDGLRATLSGQRIDSPVYYLLARSNEEPNGELPPPSAFREDVEVAKAGKDAGTLALLGEEAEPFSWSHEALRQVGRALFSLGAHERARSLWEKILLAKADDYEANKHLGNIHHRLGNLAESNIALQRVVANPSATRSQRAEVLALFAARWVQPLLYAQSATDVRVFGIVGGVLVVVAIVASGLPARRATRVDPNTVLRAD